MAHSPPFNLYKEERAALKTLRQDKNIIILQVDKGNVTVVMRTEQYKEKITVYWMIQYARI